MNRIEQIANDPLFEDAILSDNYAGDRDTLLRHMRECINQVVTDKDIDGSVKRLANTLLGRGELSPITGYHEAGIIDQVLADELDIPDESPLDRCENAVVGMIKELIQLEELAWSDEAADDILNRYANLFMGVLSSQEMTTNKIVKLDNGKYELRSKDGSKRLGGPYDTKEEAEKRERQVEYFKHKKE